MTGGARHLISHFEVIKAVSGRLIILLLPEELLELHKNRRQFQLGLDDIVRFGPN
jgi:hypothetical protein